jgi:hypothetical protein
MTRFCSLALLLALASLATAQDRDAKVKMLDLTLPIQ